MALTSTPRAVPLPFLPGYTNHDLKPNSRKPQTLTFGPGGSTDSFHKLKVDERSSYSVPRLNLALVDKLRDPFHRYDMSYRSPSHEERNVMRESARNTYRPAIAPAWLKHDRQVLKFLAYSQEPVYDCPKETFRIRCCVIYFYLEDGTIMVSEPKLENSGMPQGTFVKRHRVPKPRCLGGGVYGFEDLQVGDTVSIYSRLFKLVACDEFTRRFYYEAMGIMMPEDEEPPLDSFRAADLQQEDPVSLATRSASLAESKEYHHLSAGGNRKNAKLEQYLDNDRRVLRFDCFWDDATKYGTRLYYTLHYYLADDTAEILENMSRNSGRDPYPTFWRRSPLCKHPNITATPGMTEPDERIVYKPHDLVVGQTVDVLGREIYLYDCDAFTRDFYREYLGFEQGSISIRKPRLVHVKLKHPPHTGFGSEEDSLASCLRLTPRPPQRDMKRLIADADKVIRFEAVLANGVPQDSKRKFVVAVFLADDSIGVWELKTRNSGHNEGKFANRARRKNPGTGTWFRKQDFFVGALIEVNGSPFKLTWADDAAFSRMEKNPAQHPCADAEIVLSKIRPLQEELPKEGLMGWKEMQSRQELSLQLVDHEAIALARAYGQYEGTERRAVIDMQKLHAAM
ncbi:unnamed protein product [Effrenium voratum]|nr:unnamed protein product [Effrenium voratum]